MFWQGSHTIHRQSVSQCSKVLQLSVRYTCETKKSDCCLLLFCLGVYFKLDIYSSDFDFVADPDAIEEEMKGFIINNDEVEEEEDEEGGESGEEDEEGKRKRDDDDDIDDRLEDDDFDLIEENLGIKVNRKVSDFCVCVCVCVCTRAHVCVCV